MPVKLSNKVRSQLLPKLFQPMLEGQQIHRKVGIAIEHKDGTTTAMYKWLNKKISRQLERKDFKPLFDSIHSIDSKISYRVRVSMSSTVYKDENTGILVSCKIILTEE